MANLSNLSDRELRSKLEQYGMANIPITQTTRDLVIRKLKTVMESAGNGSTSYEHEEAVVENRPSTVKRRSVATQPSKPKTRQRASLPASTLQSGYKTDESDGNETDQNAKKPVIKHSSPKPEKKSLNGKSEVATNSSSDQMSDEELYRQLAKYKIEARAITASTKPILIKRLNHAIARQKSESTAQASKSRIQEDEHDYIPKIQTGIVQITACSFISSKDRLSRPYIPLSNPFINRYVITFIFV